jgi:hypothetical protein
MRAQEAVATARARAGGGAGVSGDGALSVRSGGSDGTGVSALTAAGRAWATWVAGGTVPPPLRVATFAPPVLAAAGDGGVGGGGQGTPTKGAVQASASISLVVHGLAQLQPALCAAMAAGAARLAAAARACGAAGEPCLRLSLSLPEPAESHTDSAWRATPPPLLLLTTLVARVPPPPSPWHAPPDVGGWVEAVGDGYWPVTPLRQSTARGVGVVVALTRAADGGVSLTRAGEAVCAALQEGAPPEAADLRVALEVGWLPSHTGMSDGDTDNGGGGSPLQPVPLAWGALSLHEVRAGVGDAYLTVPLEGDAGGSGGYGRAGGTVAEVLVGVEGLAALEGAARRWQRTHA